MKVIVQLENRLRGKEERSSFVDPETEKADTPIDPADSLSCSSSPSTTYSYNHVKLNENGDSMNLPDTQDILSRNICEGERLSHARGVPMPMYPN